MGTGAIIVIKITGQRRGSLSLNGLNLLRGIALKEDFGTIMTLLLALEKMIIQWKLCNYILQIF